MKRVRWVFGAAALAGAALLAAIVYIYYPYAPIEHGDRGDDSVFTDCPSCSEMVALPPGEFLMGLSRRRDHILSLLGVDVSLKRMIIHQGLSVSRTEITFDLWEACLADGGCGGHRPDDEGWGRGERPVINVSWRQAKDYAAWLSHKTGHAYRLLTEAEWEYGARAGALTLYAWGPRASHKWANYGDLCPPCEGHVEGADRWRHTAPVASFPPNRFGLYDMHGNVYEWVEDCMSVSEGAQCHQRVLRGGGWHSDARRITVIYRAHNPETLADRFIGFRVARVS